MRVAENAETRNNEHILSQIVMYRKLKNKLTEVFSSALTSALQQEKTQNMVFTLFDNYLRRASSQGAIDALLDRYFQREITQDISNKSMIKRLNNEEVKKAVWKANHVRPTTEGMHWAAIPNSIREQRMIQATREAGAFVQEHIPHLEGKPHAFDTLKAALDAVSLDGLYLEFGVFSGKTINFIAEQVGPEQIVHGFDSFEGLPEQWGALAEGTFNKDGQFPKVHENVKLHKGWFDQTLAPFVEANSEPVAFLHADADLYSSTKTILNGLARQIVSGTVIVFDEFINYPYWRDHEYKAFMEFIEQSGHKFEYIAYTDRGYSVAVRIR